MLWKIRDLQEHDSFSSEGLLACPRVPGLLQVSFVLGTGVSGDNDVMV